MIKILYFLPALTGGGAERTLINIANGLDRAKYEAHFMIIDRPESGKYKDEYYHLLREDVKIHDLKITIKKANYPRILLRMSKEISEIAPDIAMSTMLRPNMMLSAALKLSRFKGKTVLRESNNRTATRVNRIERKAIRYFYGKTADSVVSLSKGVKYDLCRNFSVSEDRVRVIYNPIDLESIDRLKQETADIKRGNTLVAAGRLTRQKNYPMLLKALSELKGQIDYHMFILGKGELEDEIKEQIRTEGLEDRVTLLGFQSNPYKYIANADVFVLSSDWEGFGHVIVEAMACGAAVVSTDCPYGPGEIISDHINGLLIPVGDSDGMAGAIRELLSDEALRQTLRTNAYERALDFSRDKIVRQYEELFEELVPMNDKEK